MTAARLLKAARAGDEAEIEALIARGVKGTRKQLIEAARAGETDVVDVLVRSGTKGTRPQLEAARAAGETDVVEVLLRSGADGDSGRWLVAWRRGDTAEIEALRRDGRLTEYVLADAVNAAAAANDGAALAALRDEGAPLQSTFERSVRNDDLDRARALLAHVGSSIDVSARGTDGYGWLISRALSPNMLAVLIDAGANLNPPLHTGENSPLALLCNGACAAPREHWPPGDALAMLELALAKGMNPNQRRPNGRTALEDVVGQSVFGKSTDEHRRRIRVINALVDAGADTRPALESLFRARFHPSITTALKRASANAPRRAAIDSARAFKAEKRAHPPPPLAAPSKQAGARVAAWIIAASIGAALLMALVTCR